jgi:hypothetical protein
LVHEACGKGATISLDAAAIACDFVFIDQIQKRLATGDCVTWSASPASAAVTRHFRSVDPDEANPFFAAPDRHAVLLKRQDAGTGYRSSHRRMMDEQELSLAMIRPPSVSVCPLAEPFTSRDCSTFGAIRSASACPSSSDPTHDEPLKTDRKFRQSGG